MSDEPPPGDPEEFLEVEPFPRSDDFSTDFVTEFSTGYSDSRVFFVDFRVPDVRAFPVERPGSTGGSMSGQQVSVSQVQLPPKAIKELHSALGHRIAEYEAEFGEIELDREETQVYTASADSMLLARAAIEAASAGARVLDVGTGSGYVASKVAETGATVVGADVNPHACREASENGIAAVRADLVEPFRAGAFDLVVFNPPYLPTDSDEEGDDWMDVALYGGETGRGVVGPFVDSVGRVLAPDGAALVVMSEVTGIDAVRERARANGFRTEVAAEASDSAGKLVVLRLEPGD